MIVFSIAIVIFSLQLLTALVLKVGALRLNKQVNNDQIEGISVVISFHNEQDRIGQLITSLNNAGNVNGIEVIFVNDYSDDNTVNLIATTLHCDYRLVDNAKAKGKKWAIQMGIEVAKFEYVLTLDADVHFSPDYLEHILKLPDADMVILPVEMKGEGLISKLSVIEFYFLQTLGWGAAGYGKAIIANGANLLFKRSTFLELETKRTDYGIPSGDDLFLLDAMHRTEKRVITQRGVEVSVITEAPANLKAIIQQRQRWWGKMPLLFNGSSLAALVLLMSVQIAAISIWICAVWNPWLLLVFILKYGAESISVSTLLRNNPTYIFVLLVHQIWYPIYVLLSLLPLEGEKKWEKQTKKISN